MMIGQLNCCEYKNVYFITEGLLLKKYI